MTRRSVFDTRGIASAILVSSLALGACDADERTEMDLSSGQLRAPQPELREDVLLVYVGDDGVTFMAGEPILTDGKILARAESFHARYPQGRVIVQAHRAAVHGRAVRVLELLKDAQITHVSVR